MRNLFYLPGNKEGFMGIVESVLAVVGGVAILATVLVYGICYWGAKEMDRACNGKGGDE